MTISCIADRTTVICSHTKKAFEKTARGKGVPIATECHGASKSELQIRSRFETDLLAVYERLCIEMAGIKKLTLIQDVLMAVELANEGFRLCGTKPAQDAREFERRD